MYATLRESGPLTAGGLAVRASIHPRYARDWLEQQTIAGFLTVDDPGRNPEERVYTLPDAHVAALADRDSLDHLAPLGRLVAAAAHPLEAIAHAYRTGGGVPWEAYGVNGGKARPTSTTGPRSSSCYPTSVLCCLPAGMTEPNSAATGTVMRETTLRRYAAQAGFTDVEVLAVDNDSFRLYRLHP